MYAGILLLLSISLWTSSASKSFSESCPAIERLLKQLSANATVVTPASDPRSFASSSTVWNKDLRLPYVQAIASLVVQPATERDIEAAVRYAKENSLEIAVKSGGHGAGGQFLTQGGLLLDLKLLKTIKYDSGTQTVKVGTGVTNQELTQALRPFGRSSPTGICADIGSGILHGGWGTQARRHGLAIDSIVSMQLILASGETRTVDSSSGDLWWAIRGAAPNYGVISSVTYKTFDVSDQTDMQWAQLLYQDEILFPQVARWLNSKQDDRRIGAIAVNFGGNFFLFLWIWDGSMDDLLEDSGLPSGSVLQRGNGFFTFQDFYYSFAEGFPFYAFGYVRAGGFTFTGDIDDDNRFLEAFSPTETGIGLWEMWGGAIADVTENATAFGARKSQFAWYLSDYWFDPRESSARKAAINAQYVSLFETKATGLSARLYVNYVSPEPENILLGYNQNYPRLAKIKAQYDPSNFFHLNYNIPPEKRNGKDGADGRDVPDTKQVRLLYSSKSALRDVVKE
eukprot:gb/GEZN01004065.1/.p1 GENE.gb/GEZN01004065.1/~~gb/GEZN01004065.1/.p1  ORF type:complete len:511 (+),score=52.55 gb/GEZN01004065.1/:122-1654(+)